MFLYDVKQKIGDKIKSYAYQIKGINMAKMTLLILLFATALSSNAKNITFSGKNLSFESIEHFFRKELKKVEPKPYNLYIKLSPEKKKEFASKKFTVSFHSISLKEALQSFTKANGLSLSFDGHIVVFSDFSKMTTKNYLVFTEFKDVLPKDKKGKIIKDACKTFIKSLGVQFPKGSAIKYSHVRNSVVMVNTEANHKKLRSSLKGVGLLYK